MRLYIFDVAPKETVVKVSNMAFILLFFVDRAEILGAVDEIILNCLAYGWNPLKKVKKLLVWYFDFWKPLGLTNKSVYFLL